MAVAASLLRTEMRRHLLMNFGLIASCIVGGTVVTNERGLFVPIGAHGMSETAKAFAAMFTPSHLLPGLTNNRMVAPLEPFDVTADSRDLNHRLMDAFNNFSAPGVGDDNNPLGADALTTTEYAENAPPGGDVGTPGSPGGVPGGPTGPIGPLSNFTPPAGNPNGPTDLTTQSVPPPTTAIPEPSLWAMMIAGFGAVGYVMRTRRRRTDEAGEEATA